MRIGDDDEMFEAHGCCRARTPTKALGPRGKSGFPTLKESCAPIRISCPRPASARDDRDGAGAGAHGAGGGRATTALDVTTQAQILRLIRDLQRSRNMAVMFITTIFGRWISPIAWSCWRQWTVVEQAVRRCP